ncbi:MAG: hypothetical protein CM15mP117_07340 [Alphaproteobacteria bacterium]|nr:MAG: hypothetical protein CM15mP117_07340 [Alphaproteobacteria bacterium]
MDETRLWSCFSYRATGGVGSIAVAVLAFLGYEVACVTGNVNKNTPFLKD